MGDSTFANVTIPIMHSSSLAWPDLFLARVIGHYRLQYKRPAAGAYTTASDKNSYIGLAMRD